MRCRLSLERLGVVVELYIVSAGKVSQNMSRMCNEVYHLCSLTLLLVLGLVLEFCIAGHAMCTIASTIQVCSGEYVRMRSGIFVSLFACQNCQGDINFNGKLSDDLHLNCDADCYDDRAHRYCYHLSQQQGLFSNLRQTRREYNYTLLEEEGANWCSYEGL